MPDVDDLKDTKNFHLGVPVKQETFFLKGSSSLDWGVQNRLAADIQSRLRAAPSCSAIDHGYFQGPTAGLERVDLNILPLLPYGNALMLHARNPRAHDPPTSRERSRAARERRPEHPEGAFNEQLAIDVEDAARLGVAAMAVQVFVGGEFETQSINNMTRLVDAGLRYGIPTSASPRSART